MAEALKDNKITRYNYSTLFDEQKLKLTIRDDNSLKVTINTKFLLLPLIGVLSIIFIWCFYLQFVIAYSKRKKVLWVEVLDLINHEYNISRMEAKKNLNLVAEITKRLKSFDSLFDKYWYQ